MRATEGPSARQIRRASAFESESTAMKKVFLSHSFADSDRAFASQVERVIRSHGLVPTTGRNLAGSPLTPQVISLIEEADGLIALCTQRALQPDGVTHPWVLQEYGIARAAAERAAQAKSFKGVITVWQNGVPVVGMDGGSEHVGYDPASPAESLLRLSEVLGEWKQRAGRFLKVQLLPEDIARQIGQAAAQVRCECRWQIDGMEYEWRTVEVRREFGGIFGYLRVPEMAEMIQLRASGRNINCESPYTPLRMFVQMDSIF